MSDKTINFENLSHHQHKAYFRDFYVAPCQCQTDTPRNTSIAVALKMCSRSLDCFFILILQVSYHKASQVKPPDIHVISPNKLYHINPLNPELNPICYLLTLLGTPHFLHVSRIRVKLLTFRLLMSYIYGAPILDVSRSHTTTQHSR